MDDDWNDTIAHDVAELTAAATPPDGSVGAPSVGVVRPGGVQVTSSAFDVDRLLASTASFATGELAALDGSLVDQRSIDLAHLAAWTTSTVLVDGAPVPAWADLSGVYDSADGRHLQLHCNFPHHAAGVVAHLGVPAGRESVAAGIAERPGEQLERELIERGMIAAIVRTLDEWDAHPHALATRGLPIVTIERIDDAPARPLEQRPLRVVDQSRVLAGPVAGHLLASAGCDVIRLGAGHLPSVEIGVLSTGFGKRNVDLDLRTSEGRGAADCLLSGADVWIDGYRPGALADLGLRPDRVARLRPGIVMVEISAFDGPDDTDGPWAGRRGYDSIVQSTTGVRWAGGRFASNDDGSPAGSAPRGLPVQALDHATGFLAAAVAARLTRVQRRVGGSWRARLSLLRTRDRLVGFDGPRPHVPSPVEVPTALLDGLDAPAGRVQAVRPFAGRWTGPPHPLGSSSPVWR